MCPTIKNYLRQSPLSEYVRTLDLSALIHERSKTLTSKLLGGVKGELEVFVAPQISLAVNFLATISKCRNLVGLDLSLICKSLRTLDLLRAVSTLSCLKTFHFPRCSPSSDLGKNRYGRNKKSPQLPDSLETFHVPCSLKRGYWLAIKVAPASLTSLIVESGSFIPSSMLDAVFKILGPQILTLKIEYYQRDTDELGRILSTFPNLLRLSICEIFLLGEAPIMIDLDKGSPLCSITLLPQYMAPLPDPRVSRKLQNLLKDQLPNVRSIAIDRSCWLFRLRSEEGRIESEELLNLAKLLKERRDRSSSLKECGIWEVKGDHDTQYQITEDNLKKLGHQLIKT